jgi:hypothetical protein|tara:strand:+ start:50 stop:244 length:195 start_codon:yes stop_codon:yes gene_type:complete
MTIKQKIKKARYVFVWVLIYDEDGEYIETSKANVLRLLKAIPENFKYIKQDKFVLREDGDLYIN